MPIYKITYSEKYRRATVHNFGCNFRCRGCSYKLKQQEKPARFCDLDEITACLRTLDLAAVHFMGGEPTTNPQLPQLLAFCKHDLGVITRLGHSNGSGLVLTDLDGSFVSFKAFDDGLHRDYTGYPAAPLYENFRRAYAAGIQMHASTVFIPDFGGFEDYTRIVRFVAELDRTIPFYIMGYFPVPGAPWRRPTAEEMARAVDVAREHLEQVDFSHLTSEEAMALEQRDDRFAVRQVL